MSEVKNPMMDESCTEVEMKTVAPVKTTPSFSYAFYTDASANDSDDDSDADIRASIAEKAGNSSLDTEFLADASQAKLYKKMNIKQGKENSQRERTFPASEQSQEFPARTFKTVFREAKNTAIKSLTIYIPIAPEKSPEIICGNATGIISIYAATTGSFIESFDNKTGFQVNCLVVYDPQRVSETLPGYPFDDSLSEGRVLLISAGYDKNITIWDYAAREALRTLSNNVHQWFITSVAIQCLPPGILYASEVEPLCGKSSITADLAFTNRGLSLSSSAAAAAAGTAPYAHRNLEKANEKGALSPSSSSSAAAAAARVTEPRLVIVSSSFDCIAQYWDLNTGETLFRITSQRNEINGAVCIMPLNKRIMARAKNAEEEKKNPKEIVSCCWKAYLAAGLFQKEMVLYELESRCQVFCFSSSSVLPTLVNCMGVLLPLTGANNNQQQHTLLISGHADGCASVWSAIDGIRLVDLKTKHNAPLSAVSLVLINSGESDRRADGALSTLQSIRKPKRQSILTRKTSHSSTIGAQSSDGDASGAWSSSSQEEIHCSSEDVKKRIAVMTEKKGEKLSLNNDSNDHFASDCNPKNNNNNNNNSVKYSVAVDRVKEHFQFVETYPLMAGVLAVTASVDGSIFVWELMTATVIRSLHSSCINSAFYHEQQRLVLLQCYCGLQNSTSATIKAASAAASSARPISSGKYGQTEVHVVCSFEEDEGVISYDLTCSGQRTFAGLDENAGPISCSTLFWQQENVVKEQLQQQEEKKQEKEEEQILITASSGLSIWKLPSCTLKKSIPGVSKSDIIHSIIYFKPKAADFDMYIRKRQPSLAEVTDIGLFAVFSSQGQRSLYSVETMAPILEYEYADIETTSATLWKPLPFLPSPAPPPARARVTEEAVWYDEYRPMIIVAHKVGPVSVLDLFSGKVVRAFSSTALLLENKMYFSKIIVYQGRRRREEEEEEREEREEGPAGINMDKVLQSQELAKNNAGIHNHSHRHSHSGRNPELVCVNGKVLLVLDLTTCTIVRSTACGHTDKTTDLCLHLPVASVAYNSSVLSQELLISCSMDKSLIVRSYRNLKTLCRLKTTPHNSALYSVKVYDPCATTTTTTTSKRGSSSNVTAPFDMGRHRYQSNQQVLVVVVTAGGDGKLVVWDLHSCVALKEIECMHPRGGHPIKTMHLYSTVDGRKGPFVVSVSVDGSVVVSDIDYPTGGVLSTTPYAFAAAYALDYKAELAGLWEKHGHWPRISAIHKKFGSLPFRENPSIFAEAVVHLRHDFLVTFRDSLMKVLPCLGDVVPGKNALDYAIHRKDEATLKVLLDCWKDCLNNDVGTMREQIFAHASHFLPLNTLLSLSAYPFLFSDFIGSLRMVRACPDVAVTCRYNLLSATHNNYVVACGAKDSFDLWGRLLGNDTEDGFPVTPLYVPLKNVASIGMIELYVKTAKDLRDTSLMECEIVQIALRQAWDSAGREMFARETKKFGLFFLWFSVWLYSFPNLLSEEPGGPYAAFPRVLRNVTAYACQVVMICYCLWKLYVLQHRLRCKLKIGLRHGEIQSRRTLINLMLSYCTDIWFLQDLASTIGTLVSAFMRLCSGEDTVNARLLLSPTCFLFFFKVLYYLRPLESSGPLVVMILEIAHSIRVFCFIMLVVLCGFSQAFWVLLPASTYYERRYMVWESFYNSFTIVMGSFDPAIAGTVNQLAATLLLCVFLVFMNVLMLNLLIALMGDVYSRVSEAKGSWRMNQAEIMLDMAFDFMNVDDILDEFSEGTTQPYVHVLKYTAQLSIDSDSSLQSTRQQETSSSSNKNKTEQGFQEQGEGVQVQVFGRRKETEEKSQEVQQQQQQVKEQEQEQGYDFNSNNTLVLEKIEDMQSKIDSFEYRMDNLTSKLDLILAHVQHKP